MEEILSQSLKNTQGQLHILDKEVDEMKKQHEITMKNMEVQMGQLSSDLANATRFVRTLFASGGGGARGDGCGRGEGCVVAFNAVAARTPAVISSIA